MKTSLLCLLCLIWATTTFGQFEVSLPENMRNFGAGALSQGDIYLGGNLGFNRFGTTLNGVSQDPETRFSFHPCAQYFIKDRTAVIGGLDYSYTKRGDNNSFFQSTENQFGIMGGLRQYYPCGSWDQLAIYNEIELGFSAGKRSSTSGSSTSEFNTNSFGGAYNFGMSWNPSDRLQFNANLGSASFARFSSTNPNQPASPSASSNSFGLNLFTKSFSFGVNYQIN